MLMSRNCMISALALAATMVCSPVSVAQEDSAIVAEIGGHKITAQELQKREAGRLLQSGYKYYLAEKDALEHLINDELLEMQAARESTTVDELLKRHVVVEAKDPTEDQLRFYYEGLDTDQPFEAVRDKVIDNVRQVRMKKARDAYVNSLRNQIGVLVELAPPSAHVELAGSPRSGLQTAPVQLVEFADYQCPYCQKVHPDLKRLREELGDKVALVYKDFPLPMHPLAEKAAEATRCADVQGKFWEFHDALFETKKLQVDELKQEARALNLDTALFDRCLDSGEQADMVKKDVTEGQHLGLSGTPSFFANGHFLSGAVGYAKLHEVVEQELSNHPTSSQASALAASKDVQK